MVLQQKYAACQERNYDLISATSKQAGVLYVEEKQKTQYIYQRELLNSLEKPPALILHARFGAPPR